MKNTLGPLLLVAMAASSGAQQAQPSQPPTFKSQVQLIEVDARVFDAKGKFIADLTKDDFEVLENDVPQAIQASYFIVGPQRSGAGKASTTAAAATHSGQAPAAPQTWLFFFDLNHLAPGTGFERARAAVEDFIAKRFPEGDLAGIVAGDKIVNNRLTSVRSELLNAVKTLRPLNEQRVRRNELTREWPRFTDEEEAIRVAAYEREVVQRVVQRACSDDPQYCERGDPEGVVVEKGKRMQQLIHRDSLATLSALNRLSRGLAGVPGPKTVVLLSNGFASMNIESTLRSVVGDTARAGGRVYAIDVRGLDRAGGDGIINREGYSEDPSGALMSETPKFDLGADGMNSLASDTGGMMIRSENNLGRALDRIADDAGSYYVLAYQPSNTTFDGKYRPISVRVKRPGLTVRARRGYLALDPAKMLRPHAITTTASAPGKLPLIPRDRFLLPSRIDPVPDGPSMTAVPAFGTIVAAPETRRAESVRLRPDSEERIKALSASEGAGGSELATQGWDAYQRGDVESALSAFTQAAARGDVRPWVLYATGLSQAALGREAEAVVSWERVRRAAPDFEPVYMDLADTYAQSGDLTRSLAVLRDAEKRWPRDGDLQSAIGVIHVRRGALDDGIAALVKAADAKPDDPLAHLNLGRAYELRFHRGRRYVASQRRWVAPEEDRTKAAEAYERCVKLGGPYALKAAEALSMLQWGKGTQGAR